MVQADTRPEFTPPPADGFVGSWALALLAHALLIGALTLSVQWRNKSAPISVEAELWSAIPELAAPAPPPAPTPEPTPEPEPARPEPPPVADPPKPVPAPTPATPDPQIVQEKLRQEKQQKEKQERERLEREKKERERQERERLEREKLEREKKEREKQEREKKEREKLAKEKAPPDPRAAAKAAAAEAKQLEELRLQNLQRMAGLAGGAATKSSGPSAEYAGRIRARIKPNITYTETISGNPTAEVEVRTSPDGTIISRKITRSSGVPSWDEAVLAAIDKTEVLPRDVDGKVPSSLVISFRPRD
jgi:colicin import membrane protein